MVADRHGLNAWGHKRLGDVVWPQVVDRNQVLYMMHEVAPEMVPTWEENYRKTYLDYYDQ